MGCFPGSKERREILAPIVVNDLFIILKEIRQSGITILFVEQNVRKSIQEADRTYILENGKVVPCGDSCELREEDKVKKPILVSDTSPEMVYLPRVQDGQ